MRKGVLVIGEITLPLVGGIVIAEHDCVEKIRHTDTDTHTETHTDTHTRQYCMSSGRATLNLQVIQVWL